MRANGATVVAAMVFKLAAPGLKVQANVKSLLLQVRKDIAKFSRTLAIPT